MADARAKEEEIVSHAEQRETRRDSQRLEARQKGHEKAARAEHRVWGAVSHHHGHRGDRGSVGSRAVRGDDARVDAHEGGVVDIPRVVQKEEHGSEESGDADCEIPAVSAREGPRDDAEGARASGIRGDEVSADEARGSWGVGPEGADDPENHEREISRGDGGEPDRLHGSRKNRGTRAHARDA